MARDPQLVTDFERVWHAYPRRVGKGAARKAFLKIDPDPQTVQKMIDALGWQVRQPQWLKDGGQYIPHLSTWLNQERWEDEPFELPTLSDKSVRLLRTVTGGRRDD